MIALVYKEVRKIVKNNKENIQRVNLLSKHQLLPERQQPDEAPVRHLPTTTAAGKVAPGTRHQL